MEWNEKFASPSQKVATKWSQLLFEGLKTTAVHLCKSKPPLKKQQGEIKSFSPMPSSAEFSMHTYTTG